MNSVRLSFRGFLTAIAVGLLAVSVWTRLSDYFNDIPVDLSTIESESPIIAEPFKGCDADKQRKWGCFGGGGG